MFDPGHFIKINAETISNNVKCWPLYLGEQLLCRHCVKTQVEVWAMHHFRLRNVLVFFYISL